MLSRITSLITLQLLLLACTDSNKSNTENEKYKIIDFKRESAKEVVALKAERLIFEEIMYGKKIEILDDYLIIADKDPSSLLHIIDINKRNYLRSLGVDGNGPGEIKGVTFIDKGAKSNTFWSYFMNTKRYSQFDIASSDKHAIDQTKQEGDMFLASQLLWTADSTFMALRTDFEDKFVEFNVEGKVINTYGSWMGMIDREVPASILSSLHQGPLKSSPDKNRFAFFCTMRDMIEVLDKNSGNILSLRGPLNEIVTFEVDNRMAYPMLYVPDNDLKLYYGSGYLTDKYIYGLFCGRTWDNINSTDLLSNEIFVFDYAGNLVQLIQLDASLSEMAVDNNNNKLYGINYRDQPPVIYMYDLKSL
jgi:hypothetical protein